MCEIFMCQIQSARNSTDNDSQLNDQDLQHSKGIVDFNLQHQVPDSFIPLFNGLGHNGA